MTIYVSASRDGDLDLGCNECHWSHDLDTNQIAMPDLLREVNAHHCEQVPDQARHVPGT